MILVEKLFKIYKKTEWTKNDLYKIFILEIKSLKKQKKYIKTVLPHLNTFNFVCDHKLEVLD